MKDLLGEHEGLGGITADTNGDGQVTHDELAITIVPLLFGAPVRAASYRPLLARALRAEGYTVSLVGNSCQACTLISADSSIERMQQDEPRGCPADSWLRYVSRFECLDKYANTQSQIL